MTEHALVHSRSERRRFDLGELGSLRYEGLFANRAVATAADGARLRFGPAGARRAEARDESGAVVGGYDASDPPEGRLTWAGRALVVRPVRGRRARWTVHDGADGRQLAAIEGRGTGARPATIALPGDEPPAPGEPVRGPRGAEPLDPGARRPEPLDPGLLLFLAFLVRKLAKLRTAGLGSH